MTKFTHGLVSVSFVYIYREKITKRYIVNLTSVHWKCEILFTIILPKRDVCLRVASVLFFNHCIAIKFVKPLHWIRMGELCKAFKISFVLDLSITRCKLCLRTAFIIFPLRKLRLLLDDNFNRENTVLLM